MAADAINYVEQHGDRLLDNGYVIVPIKPNTKVPGMFSEARGWQGQPNWQGLSPDARTKTLEAAKVAPSAGVGVICGSTDGQNGVIAIDIDVLDLPFAGACTRIFAEHLGETPAMRIGLAPKLLLVYRTREHFSKITMAPLECLAVGQQFVAYGIHEKTGEPYQWPMESLADIPIDRLPLVTCAQVVAAMEEAYDALPDDIKRARLGVKRDAGNVVDIRAGEHAPNPDLEGTFEACEEFINRIPNPDLHWDEWNRVGMALWAASAGQKWGWELFEQFSRRSSKYAASVTANRWKSYSKSPPNRIGIGALQHIALQYDSTPVPADILFNEAKKKAREFDISGLVGNLPSASKERPEPLLRQSGSPAPFPIEALGPLLEGAARAITDIVQCPIGLAAQSVLGTACLAAQAHGDVVIPATGHAKPISLFILTIAESGERKSAADHEALAAVRKREQAMRRKHDKEMLVYLKERAAFDKAYSLAQKKTGEEKRKAVAALPPEPKSPISPMLTCEEPTLEGLQRLYMTGQPALGIFSDEGGTFINGHGMSSDNRLRTVAGMSKFWDGSDVRRVRAGDGAVVLAGKRLCMHVLAQPEAANRLLSDPVLKDQGFLSRILVSAPQSTAGMRLQRPRNPESSVALEAFNAQILKMLHAPLPIALGSDGELSPRQLQIAGPALQIWCDFADRVELKLAPGKEYEPIKGFANKLPEHACRLAGVITLVQDPSARQIEASTLIEAIQIAEYYAGEALRLFGSGLIDPEIMKAEKLRVFLRDRWPDERVSRRALVRFGPNEMRDTETIDGAMKILVKNGWLCDEMPGNVRGQRSKRTWRVVREADE